MVFVVKKNLKYSKVSLFRTQANPKDALIGLENCCIAVLIHTRLYVYGTFYQHTRTSEKKSIF